MNIDKAQVAQRFEKAGQSYHQHALVQKQVCQYLIQLMQQYVPKIEFQRSFEIGCGSGNLSHLLLQEFSIQQLILNDLYPQVQQHFSENNVLHWQIGDIEQLNFPQKLDLIASSSALQWIGDLDQIFSQCAQALSTKGYFCFSTFGQQNLQEIKSLTGQGLNYLSMAALEDKLIHHNFEILHLSQQIETLNFAHPQEVLKHLKATGVTATASGYRWSKQSLQQFYQDYEQFLLSDSRKLPAYALSYHPIYCIARSKA